MIYLPFYLNNGMEPFQFCLVLVHNTTLNQIDVGRSIIGVFIIIIFSLYTFDVRKLKQPVNIHMDHTSAVIDVDYSPTGREFVTGSYDKSIRIFESLKGHSRDVYHTKRMQRLTCVKWSLDNKYVLSGSDEMNIRMWKARASEKLGIVSII